MKENPFDTYAAEYENWFLENSIHFQSELLALQQVVSSERKGVEIGIGSGIFAEKLNIKFGIDPAENMLSYARQRNLTVTQGVAENLPYIDHSFDFAVFITSLCFIDNPLKALQEAYRIIRSNGELIIAIIDKESFLGQLLIAEKEHSKFYKNANFYTVKELILLLESANFEVIQILQTLTDLNNNEVEQPIEGFGLGSFVVIKATKK